MLFSFFAHISEKRKEIEKMKGQIFLSFFLFSFPLLLLIFLKENKKWEKNFKNKEKIFNFSHSGVLFIKNFFHNLFRLQKEVKKEKFLKFSYSEAIFWFLFLSYSFRLSKKVQRIQKKGETRYGENNRKKIADSRLHKWEKQ